MAPVDPDLYGYSNLEPIAYLAGESILILGLLTATTWYFFRAHRALPPAAHTRSRHAVEHQHLPVFLGLGALSLSVAVFLKSSWRVASFQEYARRNHVVLPGSIWEYDYTTILSDPGVPLGPWWTDASIFNMYFWSILSSPGSFWSTCQLLTSTVIWSVFVGIEGRHRNISIGYILTFVLLSQTVGLSSAVNFFFAALLLTPVPLSNGVKASRDGAHLTIPHPTVLLIPAILAFGWITVLPAFLDFPAWPVISYAGYFALPLLLASLAQPNSLPYIQHADVSSARGSYRRIFHILTLLSPALYYIQTGLVIKKTLETSPPKPTLQHNFLWNTHTKVSESFYHHTFRSIGKLLGSLSEDAIASVTLWDLLLTGLSLCVWAYLQNVHVHSILSVIGVTGGDDPDFPSDSSVDATEVGSKPESLPEPVKKRRGRPRKNTAQTDEAAHNSTPARKSRRTPTVDGEADSEYTPTPEVQGQVAELEALGASNDAVEQNTGAGALTWVISVFGGLAMAMSAILGAEVAGG